MASAQSQDFSVDTTAQMNKYGFTQPYAVPHAFYPSPMPMTGYYAPIIQNDNPTQELMQMGFSDLLYTDTSSTTSDPQNPYSFELKLKGIDRTFTGSGIAKKKARKAAAQSALDFLSDPANIPEGLEVKTPKKNRGSYIQPVPSSPWGQMAPPPGYMMPMPAHYQQVDPTTTAPLIKENTPQKTTEKSPTPFLIMREKYPNFQFKAEVTCTVTVEGQDYSVTMPGSNFHLARMMACTNALKELEGMEFPKWERKLERVQENARDSSGIQFHPVSLLLREYGVKNVSFKHDRISDPCTVTVNEAGEYHTYASAVMSNKRQAKYEAALKAIKELNLDSKFSNILPYQTSEMRKRKHDEPEDNLEGVGDSWGLEGAEKAPDPAPETMDPASQSEPELVISKSEIDGESKTSDPVISPTPEKRARMETAEKSPPKEDAPEERRQPVRSTAPPSTRFARGRNPRDARVLIRGQRGQIFGAYRGSQQRYF